jgi:hypothetical protein
MVLFGLLMALSSSYQYTPITEHLKKLDIPLEARSNVLGIFVLLLGNLRLVVKVLVAQSLELLTGVLFAFGGGVVIA